MLPSSKAAIPFGTALHRGRAWRRAQRLRMIESRRRRFLYLALGRRIRRGRFASQRACGFLRSRPGLPPEKRWSQLYLRSVKLHRAKQLGLPYPFRPWPIVSLVEHGAIPGPPLRVLFVCSKNQWRSPTAERLWEEDSRFSVRSAGTSANARRRVRSQDLEWADVIVAMEHKHKERLLDLDRRPDLKRKVVVANIADLPYMSPPLIQRLQERVAPMLEARLRAR